MSEVSAFIHQQGSHRKPFQKALLTWRRTNYLCTTCLLGGFDDLFGTSLNMLQLRFCLSGLTISSWNFIRHISDKGPPLVAHLEKPFVRNKMAMQKEYLSSLCSFPINYLLCATFFCDVPLQKRRASHLRFNLVFLAVACNLPGWERTLSLISTPPRPHIAQQGASLR